MIIINRVDTIKNDSRKYTLNMANSDQSRIIVSHAIRKAGIRIALGHDGFLPGNYEIKGKKR